MKVKSIKTRIILPPKDNLLSVIKEIFDAKKLKEESILVITSKVVSLWQGKCIPISNKITKDKLIKEEAEFYLPRHKIGKNSVMLTIKNNIMIPAAGIDESNSNGHYTLWPEKPFSTAKTIHDYLTSEYGISKLGIIISDSHTVPLRWGTMGVAIAYWGFQPLKDYRGKKDIFGRTLKYSQLNIADILASAAVLAMGEGDEQTPLVLIEEIPFVQFGIFNFLKKNPLAIKKENDIYGPLLNAIKWKKGERRISQIKKTPQKRRLS